MRIYYLDQITDDNILIIVLKNHARDKSLCFKQNNNRVDMTLSSRDDHVFIDYIIVKQYTAKYDR